MISEPVLIDAGPRVALLHRHDTRHKICKAQSELLTGTVATSWPVITEAAWLLRQLPDGIAQLMQLIERRDIVAVSLDDGAAAWIAATAHTYRDLSPQLADLSLLYLAERHGWRHVFTLDRRDFAVYRRTDGQPFVLLPQTV